MFRRCFAFALAFSVLSPLYAQKKLIDRADQLPRFTYKVDAPAEELLRNEEKFRPLATAVRTNLEGLFRDFEIGDKSAQRTILLTLTRIAMLENEDNRALEYLARLQDLEEKPAARFVAGLIYTPVIAARSLHPDMASEGFRRALRQEMKNRLANLPWKVVEDSIRERRYSNEIMSRGMIVGQAVAQLQPMIEKTGALSDTAAAALILAKFNLTTQIPNSGVISEALGEYIASKQRNETDIWKARSVTLKSGQSLQPVPIAVWDSGVDLNIYDKALLRDEQGRPAIIAFDIDGRPASSPLLELTDEEKQAYPEALSLHKGARDIRYGLTTREAAFAKERIQALTPATTKAFSATMNRLGEYMHGTHVAGIALDGNPYAKLYVARHSFDTRNPPAVPSKERAERIARAYVETVAGMRKNKVRVANMSWSWTTTEIERAYELNGLGATAEERRKLAREIWDIIAAGLKTALESAPEILFVASAGNTNESNEFIRKVPANLELPNLILVGAVDQDGSETSFTSYGRSISVHANGYDVESPVPGGKRLLLGGTSMAAPNVTNLAAKILAVAPNLNTAQVIEVIKQTAEKSEDGRRILIHPAKALQLAKTK